MRTVKQEKIDKVENLNNILAENKGIALFENHGIMAGEINEIRSKVRKNGITAFVVKNTLLSIAVKNNIKNINKDVKIKGKMIGFYAENAIDALGIFETFSKNEKKLLTPVSIIDKNGIIFDPKKTKSIAKMKNKQGMIGGLIMILKTPTIKLVKILEIIKEKI